jgi:flagellar hook-associated protein 3 FlgL
MRITDSIRHHSAIANMQRSQRGLTDAQAQVSSGKRIQKPSEDPNAEAVILQTRATLRGIQQHQRNIDIAIARVEAEESTLNQLNDALGRALELAVSQAGDMQDATTRRQVKYEVDNLVAHVVGLGNTRFGTSYLFGGHASETPPFDPADPLGMTPAQRALVDQPHEVEAAVGQRVETNHNGVQVFLDTGAFQALLDFADALGADDSAGIRAATETLRGAAGRVHDLMGDVGGRYNHLQVTAQSLDVLDLSTTTLQSDLEDVDMSKAMIELVSRQTSFQSAMMATSRILGLGLADYIR